MENSAVAFVVRVGLCVGEVGESGGLELLKKVYVLGSVGLLSLAAGSFSLAVCTLISTVLVLLVSSVCEP